MVATADVIDEVRLITDERNLLKHPFYQPWQKGELTLDALRGYAAQYYPHVLAFPQYVSTAHAICPDRRDRQELLENLIEEERGDEIHPAVGAAMVRRHTHDDTSREAVLATARECAEALWSFLDGCQREYVAA
jgi:pyrroloquinoline quinone (PQQ) biosynthesis protein C